MKKLMLALAVCLSAFAVGAQDDTFESLKARLDDKALPLVNINVEIDKVSKPKYTNATFNLAGQKVNDSYKGSLKART